MKRGYVMSEPVRKRQAEFTYTDIITWPEGERWELIDGVAYDMSPAPSQRHQDISRELTWQILSFLQGKPCRLFYAPFDVRLPTAEEDGMTASTVVQPDIIVVCTQEKLDGRGCVGAPTLVVEITSPSTAAKDLYVKKIRYEQAGVPEYWLILPGEQTLLIFTLDKTGRYGDPAVYTSEDHAPVGVLPGLSIDLERVFAAA